MIPYRNYSASETSTPSNHTPEDSTLESWSPHKPLPECATPKTSVLQRLQSGESKSTSALAEDGNAVFDRFTLSDLMDESLKIRYELELQVSKIEE